MRSVEAPRVLVLHIGLPKTGTTFLQQQVFARATGTGFMHRRHSPETAALCRDLRRYVRSGALLAGLRRRRVQSGLASIAPRTGEGSILLLSDEGISVHPGAFWRGEGPGPRLVAWRLSGLLHQRPIRVIIGIRRQDQWLASRYAESSKNIEGLDQVDFDRRMLTIAQAEYFEDPLTWLDYAAVHKEFAGALGPENVLMVPLEHIGAAPEKTIKRLISFVGAGLNDYGPPKSSRRMRNQLSKAPNTWRMRRGGGVLRLAPEIEAALRARFAGSNAALAQLLPEPFGA